MKQLVLISILCLFSFHFRAKGQEDAEYKMFRQGFQHPPPSSRPHVIQWFLGGYTDTLRLKEELSGFKNAGISGLTIVEIGSRDTVLIKAGPAFLSDESLKILKYAIRHHLD